MTLTWKEPNVGPMQVQGANLAAAFPDLTVENETFASTGDGSSVPAPKVTLSREFQPGASDYAFRGGLPPDHQALYTWSWKPVGGSWAAGTVSFPSVRIEAQSAAVEEQSHSSEFLSGVLFGVAASAAVGAVTEFVNSGRNAARLLRGAHARLSSA